MSRRVIITGGGTGGHIFPAISIASELKRIDPAIEILFVGAEGGMEMRVVPQYGFKIEGVKISGIMRSLTPKNILKNLVLPFKLLGSLLKSGRIIREFRPQVVVGVVATRKRPCGQGSSQARHPGGAL
ncbi:MAG: glycosyltransferase [Bacteroidia bacterium]